MIIDIRLKQFRNYSETSFEFNLAVTIVVGPNGCGKTNLLEAVLVACRGKSYRAGDADLVQFDKSWARLDATTSKGTRTVKLTPDALPKKTYELNGKIYRRLSARQSLPVVLFEPDNLRMLTGAPQRRRDYVDELLAQTSPSYGASLSRYKKALAQRNHLLKINPVKIREQIFPWDVRLSQLAGNIASERLKLTDKLNQGLPGLYRALSKTDDQLAVSYSSACDLTAYETSMLQKLEASLDLDSQRGFTSVGIHRDDLAFALAAKDMSVSASRGETRTTVLALKIIELQIIEEAASAKPILLLDDVFSELDGARRHALTDYLKSYQTLITTTDADLAVESFANDCQVIPLGQPEA